MIVIFVSLMLDDNLLVVTVGQETETVDFINLHCVLFYCNGGCGLSVLCNKEYDDDDDDGN